MLVARDIEPHRETADEQSGGDQCNDPIVVWQGVANGHNDEKRQEIADYQQTVAHAPSVGVFPGGLPGFSPGRGHNCRVVVQLRVVVVDDHRLTAHGVSDSLRSRGIDVVTTEHSVADATEAVQRLRPDVIVSDLDMGPGPNGIDLALAMRKSHPGVGIVLLTAYEDPKLLSPQVREAPWGVVYLVKHHIADLSDLYDAVLLARDYASGAVKPPGPSMRFPLSTSQAALLRLLARGLSNQAIAEELSLTEDSVAKSVNRLAKRLDVDSSGGRNVRVGLTQRYFDMVGYQREA